MIEFSGEAGRISVALFAVSRRKTDNETQPKLNQFRLEGTYAD
jgi:hypothetical protein